MTIGEMIAVSRALVAALAAVAFSAAAATAPPAAPAKAGASASASVPTIQRNARFSQLGARSSLQLRGDGDSATLDFGCRSDELVTRATLRLRYVGSPALAPGVSHVRLALNGDTIATLPLGEGLEISSLWLATLISLGSAGAIFRTV